MARSDVGTIPETITEDTSQPGGRPDAVEDPGLDMPDATLDRNPDEILAETRQRVRDGQSTINEDDLEVAIQTSVATLGAGETRDRILTGRLEDPNGNRILDDVPAEQRQQLAVNLESGIKARSEQAVEMSPQAESLQGFENRAIRPMVENGYENPEAAMEKLRSMSDEERTALRDGDTSVLGRPQRGADIDTVGLSAYGDVWDQQPGAASQIRASQDRELAREQRQDLSGTAQDPELDPNPARPGADQRTPDQLMAHQLSYQGYGLQQV